MLIRIRWVGGWEGCFCVEGVCVECCMCVCESAHILHIDSAHFHLTHGHPDPSTIQFVSLTLIIALIMPHAHHSLTHHARPMLAAPRHVAGVAPRQAPHDDVAAQRLTSIAPALHRH